MNFERYPWLNDLDSAEGQAAIADARRRFDETGAVTFPHFVTEEFLQECLHHIRGDQEAKAFTTLDSHTVYLESKEDRSESLASSPNSVRNFEMMTHVASLAYDELNVQLQDLYRHETLRELVRRIVLMMPPKEQQQHQEREQLPPLYCSDDPLGCCSINVFRPNYHHSFHFDESEFSTTLMLQEASVEGTGLFQYTPPFRKYYNEHEVNRKVASALKAYDTNAHGVDFSEHHDDDDDDTSLSTPPPLHTLLFQAGTLSIFAGRQSLHRVTAVQGNVSRLVAVLTFATQPGFCNSAQVQELFWGRSIQPDINIIGRSWKEISRSDALSSGE